MVLRDYQTKAVNSVQDALRNGMKKILVSMPLGTGKSSIIVELLYALKKTANYKKILLLDSTKEMLFQLQSILDDRGMLTTKKLDDSNNEAIVLQTYSAIASFDSLSDFDLIICDGISAIGSTIQKVFINTQSIFIGFTAPNSQYSKNWFNDAYYAYEYTYEDSIKDGYITSATQREYGLALEGFCCRLFKSLGYSIEQQDSLGAPRCFPDIVISKTDYKAIVEIKAYRNRFIASHMVDLAMGQILKYKKLLQESELSIKDFFLILFCEIDEQIKNQLYNDHKIIVLDITNLLFLCKDDYLLNEELYRLTYYPIESIMPKAPIAPINQSTTELQNFDIEECANFEKRLSSCKAGEKSFREYEKICIETIKYLFDGEFTQISDQHKTGDAMFKMDLLCGIKGSTAFWELLIQHYNTRFVVFEFKNYGKRLQQNLIYVTEKYLFNTALRNVAFIISRKGFSGNANTASLGCLKENGKLIIDLTDKDLIDMLHKKKTGEEPSDYLLWKLERLLMSVSK